MKRLRTIALTVAISGLSWNSVEAKAAEYLIKLKNDSNKSTTLVTQLERLGARIESFSFGPWLKVALPEENKATTTFMQTHPAVAYVQPNYRVHLLNDYKLRDQKMRELARRLHEQKTGPFANQKTAASADNPAIPPPGSGRSGQGSDPNFNQQWGMQNSGVREAWKQTKGSPEIVVAVIDTGVDYTHEDLVGNLWRNTNEIPNNNLDDDQNGYIDDEIGWDFAKNDNKPYDLAMSLFDILMGGGNPGHGTHCAGNVGAQAENGKGIAGVAPNIRIMAIRFLSEKGEGTTDGAIKAVEYAIKNGAHVMSNSWGSEGEDGDAAENRALREMIQYAQDQGVLFVAAAGNGHNGVGYDNDSDARPGFPASYDTDIIVSVAALDINNNLGAFSNWGKRSVDLGAPGVKVFSTVPNGKYSDTVVNFGGMVVTWDGTSMATPHVAGAAALYWSKYPQKSWREVKEALLLSAKATPAVANRVVSGGRLDVAQLLAR